MRISTILFCVVASMTAYGCGDDDDADDFYDYYYDVPVTTAYWEDMSSSTMYGMSDPFEDPYYYDTFLTVSREAPDDPEMAAEIVEGSLDGYFEDGCASSDRAGSELTVTFSDCIGPFSNQTIDGMFHVSFENEDDGSIAFEVTSEDLMIDGQDATFTADASYSTSADGEEKTVHYTSERSFTSNKRLFEGNFDSTLTWNAGSRCVTRNAMGEVTTADRTFDVQIEDYQRCAGACPTSGVVTVRGPDDMSKLTFSGGGMAQLERENEQVKVQAVRFDCE